MFFSYSLLRKPEKLSKQDEQEKDQYKQTEEEEKEEKEEEEGEGERTLLVWTNAWHMLVPILTIINTFQRKYFNIPSEACVVLYHFLN